MLLKQHVKCFICQTWDKKLSFPFTSSLSDYSLFGDNQMCTSWHSKGRRSTVQDCGRVCREESYFTYKVFMYKDPESKCYCWKTRESCSLRYEAGYSIYLIEEWSTCYTKRKMNRNTEKHLHIHMSVVKTVCNNHGSNGSWKYVKK